MTLLARLVPKYIPVTFKAKLNPSWINDRPVLSNATVTSVTSTTATPRVTVTIAIP